MSNSNSQSYRINNKLWLVKHDVNTTQAKVTTADIPTNHVAVIDCSGSMSSDLPKIRQQLKSKLKSLVKEHDTVSIVWFSGKGQYGTLLEGEEIATLADLKGVSDKIDRWLKPIGMTGFKEPLEEVAALVGRVSRHGNPFSMLFLTDGCDNQWPRDQILKALDKAVGGLAASTFIEYGYCADRPLLTQMAERAGGTLIFAQDFAKYDAAFTASVAKRPQGKRVEVNIGKCEVVGGFAWALADGDLLTFAVEPSKTGAGVVKAPENVGSIWWLSPSAVGDVAGIPADSSECITTLPPNLN
jgi:hypothetical protein